MTKKTLSLVLALAFIASCCASAQAAVSSTKSYTLSVTIPVHISIPDETIQPLNFEESISKFSVKEYNIRFIEFTEIVYRGEPVLLKSFVAL